MGAAREGNGKSQITHSKIPPADEHISQLTTPGHAWCEYHSNTHARGLSRVTQQRGWDLKVSGKSEYWECFRDPAVRIDVCAEN